jgi:hypothetical protein
MGRNSLWLVSAPAPKTYGAAQTRRPFRPLISKIQKYRNPQMRKSECVNLLARHLGVRATRLTSLVQRLSESGFLPTSAGPPYPDLSPVEIARMMIVAVTDEGLGAAPATIQRYGGLRSAAVDLETALGHALMRPEAVLPAHSSLVIHVSDTPSAVLTTMTPDGSREQIFADPWRQDGVERTVRVSGAALANIASEIAGTSSADSAQVNHAAEAVN